MGALTWPHGNGGSPPASLPTPPERLGWKAIRGMRKCFEFFQNFTRAKSLFCAKKPPGATQPRKPHEGLFSFSWRDRGPIVGWLWCAFHHFIGIAGRFWSNLVELWSQSKVFFYNIGRFVETCVDILLVDLG